MNKIRIRISGSDYRVLDQAAKDILEMAQGTGATVAGPIPLPSSVGKYSNTNHLHKRLLDIINSTEQTMMDMKNLNLPYGVDIVIQMV